MKAESRAQQQTAVGEGLALGAVMAGIEAVNGNKGTLELNFRRAWRDWPYMREFPTIKAGPTYDDVLHIMRKSSRRQSPIVAEWQGEWPFIPILLQDWSDEELAESIAESVPARAWHDLVDDWLTAD